MLRVRLPPWAPAGVVKLADTLGLGPSAFGRAGSTPVSGISWNGVKADAGSLNLPGFGRAGSSPASSTSDAGKMSWCTPLSHKQGLGGFDSRPRYQCLRAFLGGAWP